MVYQPPLCSTSGDAAVTTQLNHPPSQQTHHRHYRRHIKSSYQVTLMKVLIFMRIYSYNGLEWKAGNVFESRKLFSFRRTHTHGFDTGITYDCHCGCPRLKYSGKSCSVRGLIMAGRMLLCSCDRICVYRYCMIKTQAAAAAAAAAAALHFLTHDG